MSNTITIELCKEDRARLDAILAALKESRPNCSACVESASAAAVHVAEYYQGHPVEEASVHLEPQVAETNSPGDENPEVEPIIENPDPEPAPQPAPVAAPVVISLAEFQKAVTLAVSKGPEAKKAAKEIINKYAASVSAVPEDKRAEAMAELSKI